MGEVVETGLLKGCGVDSMIKVRKNLNSILYSINMLLP